MSDRLIECLNSGSNVMRVFCIKDSIHEIVQQDNDVRLRLYRNVPKNTLRGVTIPLREFEEEFKFKTIEQALAYYDEMLAGARRLFGE